jgi:hypothetical protein
MADRVVTVLRLAMYDVNRGDPRLAELASVISEWQQRTGVLDTATSWEVHRVRSVDDGQSKS